jgi:hypothetical protein
VGSAARCYSSDNYYTAEQASEAIEWTGKAAEAFNDVLGKYGESPLGE